MNFRRQADNMGEGTLEYILTNLKYCLLHEEAECLLVNYLRGTDEIDDSIAYADLDMTRPGLSETLVYLARSIKQDTEFSKAASATCSYALGAYVDVSSADLLDETFPYLSNITQVKSTQKPGVFHVTCLKFMTDTRGPAMLPYAVVDAEDGLSLPAAAMEKLWPGSSKYIPVMESLGYTDQHIVHTLYVGLPQFDTHVSLDGVQFNL